MSRKTFIIAIGEVIKDSIHIIDNPELKLSEENRMNSDVCSYTRNCVLCPRKDNVCPSSCYMGTNKSCLKLKCHPHGDLINTRHLALAIIFWTKLIELMKIQHDSMFRQKNRKYLWQLIEEVDFETYNLYSNERK